MHRALWLAAAGAVSALAALIWMLAFRVERTQWRDGQLLFHLERLNDNWPLNRLAAGFVKLGDPVPFAVIAVAVIAAALVRMGVYGALVVGTGLLLAGATTQALKRILEEQRDHPLIRPEDIASTAWPSGHSTATMSLALFAVIVASPRLRPVLAVVAVGAALATGVSLGIRGWHYPSDAAGGYAIAAAWACLAMAALRPRASDRAATAAPRRRSRRATG